MRLLRHAAPIAVDAAAAFRALHGAGGDAFWLDSGPGGRSMLGTGRRVEPGASVLGALRRELAELREQAARPVSGAAGADAEPASAGSRPVPLGLVGWLGYGVAEETTGVPVRGGGAADTALLRVDRAVVVDEGAGEVELVALGDEWSGERARWRDATLDALASAPARAPHPAVAHPAARTARWRDDEASYLARIARCRQQIRDGEAYQLCLTTEARIDGPVDVLAVHDRLRRSHPSHHGGLLRIGGRTLVSVSPERFLEIGGDGMVTTRPIKGTRPRGSDATADAALRDELRASEKERAENLMIVDLMRNDLSRVCEPGTVAVTGLLEVESYPSVHQLVSTIRGRLAPGADAVDAIAACFPAGSMTGAPKRRAIELLDELEGRPRGVYAGAFGYLGVEGRVDLAMTIRSIVVDADGATVGAGGGITALSVPAEEVAEVRLKAAPLLAALGAEPAALPGATIGAGATATAPAARG